MMGLQQPITTMAFNSTIKGTEIPAVAEAYKCMSDASLRIKEFIRLKNPDKSEIDEEGRELFNVAVTVGGTWQEGPYLQNWCCVCGIC